MFSSATSGYIADLPVRFNKKFYPPAQPDGSLDILINTPLRFPNAAIAEEYDFSAERKALDDFQLNLQQHASKKSESNQPDADGVVDNGSSGYNSSASSWSSIPLNDEHSDKPAVTPGRTRSVNIYAPLGAPSSATVSSVSFLPTNGILQPTVAKAPASNSTPTPAPGRPNLRLEDFESVTSSPFDMVELKSINDIEELRRLWAQSQSNGYVS